MDWFLQALSLVSVISLIASVVAYETDRRERDRHRKLIESLLHDSLEKIDILSKQETPNAKEDETGPKTSLRSQTAEADAAT